jgi:hypothetical protein
MNKKQQIVSLLCVLVFSPLVSFAQLGGEDSFEFLKLATNARTVALGGVNVSSGDADVNMFTSNPALLTDETDRFFSFAYHAYYAGIGNSSLAYVHDFEKYGTWGFSMQYLNYGKFDSFDASGNSLGDFSAKDYAFAITHSKELGVYTLGLTAKFVGSSIGSYNASAVFFDIGGTFKHPSKDFTAALVFKNLGFSLGNFMPNSEFNMPFDLTLGASFKPENMPFRFSLTAHNLNRKNIAFNDPRVPDNLVNGKPVEEDISGTDRFSRHFVIGGEFVLNKNLNLRFGYNFLRRKELSVETRTAMVGFSFGLMVRVKAFEFAYSRSLQHLTGGTNNITLILDTRKLLKGKKVVN